MSSFPNQLGPGLFVPTTNVWDVSEIYSTDVTSPEFKELLVRLYQNLNNISLALNLKDSGYYTETEFVTGQAFFPNPSLSSTTPATPTFRPTFRQVINFGSLPDDATTSVPHNIAITNNFTFTRIYGTANDTTGLEYIPLPYASDVEEDIIQLNVDSTNVNITTAGNRTNFDTTYVVVEYIKN